MPHVLNAHCLIIYASCAVISVFGTFAMTLTFLFHTTESPHCVVYKTASKGPLENARSKCVRPI